MSEVITYHVAEDELKLTQSDLDKGAICYYVRRLRLTLGNEETAAFLHGLVHSDTYCHQRLGTKI